MPSTAETLFTSKCCPNCGHVPVAGHTFAFGSKNPTFFCPSCGEQLTTGIKLQLLWGLLFAFIAFPACRMLLDLAAESMARESVLFRVLQGGLISAAAAATVTLMVKGIVLRRWNGPNQR
jgi:predicted RNA-binding Zn-ribbon protein involved in translation (DUF1610 family)